MKFSVIYRYRFNFIGWSNSWSNIYSMINNEIISFVGDKLVLDDLDYSINQKIKREIIIRIKE